MKSRKSITYILFFIIFISVPQTSFAQIRLLERIIIGSVKETDGVTSIALRRAFMRNGRLVVSKADNIIVKIPSKVYPKYFPKLKNIPEVESYFSKEHLPITNEDLAAWEHMRVKQFLNSKGSHLKVDATWDRRAQKALEKYRKNIKGSLRSYAELERNTPPSLKHPSMYTKLRGKFPGLRLRRRVATNPYVVGMYKDKCNLLKKAGLISKNDKLSELAVNKKMKELEKMLSLKKMKYAVRSDEDAANPRYLLLNKDFCDYYKEDLKNLGSDFTPSLCFSNDNLSLVFHGPNNSSVSISCVGEVHITCTLKDGTTRNISFFSEGKDAKDKCKTDWEFCLGLKNKKKLSMDVSIDLCGLSIGSSNLRTFSASIEANGSSQELISF